MSPDDIQLSVGPRNTRSICTVECRINGVRHRDRFNPDSERSRRKFVNKMKAQLGYEPNTLACLDSLILDRADDAGAALAADTQLCSVVGATDSDAIPLVKAIETDRDVLEAAEQFRRSPRKFDELRRDFAAVQPPYTHQVISAFGAPCRKYISVGRFRGNKRAALA